MMMSNTMRMTPSQSRATAQLPARHANVMCRVASLERPATESKEVISGLKHLPEEARMRATDKKANKFEKVKVQKCGSAMWTEAHELAKLLREGQTEWSDLNMDDVDIRLKFAGMFHRGKRTPKRFMMRLKVREPGNLAAAAAGGGGGVRCSASSVPHRLFLLF